MKYKTIPYKMKKTIAAAINEGKDIDEILQKINDEYEDLNKEQLQELKDYIEKLQQDMHKEDGIRVEKSDQLTAVSPLIIVNDIQIRQTEVEKILDDQYDEYIDVNCLEAVNDWYDRDTCLDKMLDKIEYHKDIEITEENKQEMIVMYALEEIDLQYENGKELSLGGRK